MDSIGSQSWFTTDHRQCLVSLSGDLTPAVLPALEMPVTVCRRGVLTPLIVTAAILVAFAMTAAPAWADSTLLPMPAADSCAIASNAGLDPPTYVYPTERNWTLRRLIVTSSATVTSAQALVTQDGSAQPTEVTIRANDGTVGTSSWTIVGTLSQVSSQASGSRYLVSYSGSISLTPGTYWVGVRGTGSATTTQSVCAVDNPVQSPWHIETSTSPTWYSTTDNGASYSSGTNVRANYISLSGSLTPAASAEDVRLPPPVLEQFGKPSGMSCDASEPDGLDWAGVSSGGWGQSWAQWPNGGTGGPVCTRTVSYSTALAKWIIS